MLKTKYKHWNNQLSISLLIRTQNLGGTFNTRVRGCSFLRGCLDILDLNIVYFVFLVTMIAMQEPLYM